MCLLDPLFDASVSPLKRVGRLQVGKVARQVDKAVDDALMAAAFEVDSCDIEENEWEEAISATNDILWAEAAISNLEIKAHWCELQVGENLAKGLDLANDTFRLDAARSVQSKWSRRLAAAVDRFGVIVSPTIEALPPTMDVVKDGAIRLSRFTSPVNLSGLPALALPIPSSGLPSNMQFIGPADGEALLVATAAVVEASLLSGG
jgi:Asp-tRNA(Asn)/Glu-tRNA(Gln) amidotransferase A subunit family amidase